MLLEVAGVVQNEIQNRALLLLTAQQAGAPLTMGTGWTIFSYLIAGMLAYGGIGWLIGHFTRISLLFPIGMLVGLAISVGWIIYRYGRPHELGTTPKGDDR